MVRTYDQLCPVLFGCGAIEQIGEKAKEFGSKKAFLIYDKGVESAGLVEKALAPLEAAGIEVTKFGDVIAELPDTVLKVTAPLVYNKGYDLVVGLGGGSSLDTAKCVAVLTENPLPAEQYYNNIIPTKTKLILVPTASGTGSESTLMAVIHDLTRDSKEVFLHPADLAIVDPALTATCPPAITAASGIDAFSHAVEAFTSGNANPKADLLAKEAMRLIIGNLYKAYENPSDMEARTNLALASNYAGMAFSDASVQIGHCIAHEIGIQFELEHGKACAIATPGTIRFCAPVQKEKTRIMAELLGAEVSDADSAEELAQKAIDKFYAFVRGLGMPSLKSLGCSREAVVACAQGAIDKNWFHIMAPRPVKTDELAALLGQLYDEYQ